MLLSSTLGINDNLVAEHDSCDWHGRLRFRNCHLALGFRHRHGHATDNIITRNVQHYGIAIWWQERQGYLFGFVRSDAWKLVVVVSGDESKCGESRLKAHPVEEHVVVERYANLLILSKPVESTQEGPFLVVGEGRLCRAQHH